MPVLCFSFFGTVGLDRDAGNGNQDMDVRMMQQALVPGVQDDDRAGRDAASASAMLDKVGLAFESTFDFFESAFAAQLQKLRRKWMDRSQRVNEDRLQ